MVFDINPKEPLILPDLPSESKFRSNRIASVGIAVFGGLSIGLLALSLPFVWPALRGHVLPYIPATDSQVNNVLRLVKRCRPSSVIDLGSGDGRLVCLKLRPKSISKLVLQVIECAKLGINSSGVELNPWLVLYSRIRSRILGINRLTRFERKDLWKVNTSSYDNVIIFGVEEMMIPLEDKIKSDCEQNKRQISVIACRFPFANWRPIESVGTGIDTVWLYRYPSPTSM